MNFMGRLHLGRVMCTLARQNFSEECERALNKQIFLELKASHEYLAMAYHFDRCDMALPGAYSFFKEASDEERSHAEKLMQYLNKRGGQIMLEALPAPKSRYESIMEAMTQALEMERTVNESLLEVHMLATKTNDPNLCDFIDGFLQEQVDAQKQLADYITQLQRCQNQLGDFVFDTNLSGKKSMH